MEDVMTIDRGNCFRIILTNVPDHGRAWSH
jgi:hypothetical protein